MHTFFRRKSFSAKENFALGYTHFFTNPCWVQQRETSWNVAFCFDLTNKFKFYLLEDIDDLQSISSKATSVKIANHDVENLYQKCLILFVVDSLIYIECSKTYWVHSVYCAVAFVYIFKGN